MHFLIIKSRNYKIAIGSVVDRDLKTDRENDRNQKRDRLSGSRMMGIVEMDGSRSLFRSIAHHYTRLYRVKNLNMQSSYNFLFYVSLQLISICF